MALLKMKCQSCGHIFEEITDFERMAQLRCPECGGEVARAYVGKALFGQVRADEPQSCEACPRGTGCPWAV